MINKQILKNLKLIVCDLDGTLLTTDGMLGKETIRLVKTLKEMGVRFSFASGRLHSALLQYAEELNIKSPLISLDGSLIKNCHDGQVIFESFVPEKYVDKAISLADKYLLKIALCQSDAIYYTESNSVIPDMMDKFGAKYEEVSAYSNYTKKTLEIVFASDYKDSIKYVRNKLTFPYAFGLNVSYFKSHSHPGIYYLEVRKKGINKGTGLKRLLKYFKFNMKETAVIGDWYNDRSLFETGALKIAIANAIPEIKNKADFITKRNNNEDGVAEFLEMVLKSKI